MAEQDPLPRPRTHRAAAVRALHAGLPEAAAAHALLAIEERLDALVLAVQGVGPGHDLGRQTIAQQARADDLLPEGDG